MKLIRPVKITDSGASFTRGSTGTYFDRLGILQTAPVDTPRITFEYSEERNQWILYGVLIERSQANLLLNQSTPATQAIQVTAQEYTFSYYGSGQVTLQGVTSQALQGTHTNTRKYVTFTPQVGTLDITPTGDVKYWQLEVGSLTSYIPTTSQQVTRQEDVVIGSGYVYSNVPENDHPLWVSGQTYALGDRVVRNTSSTHYIYERLSNGSGVVTPENDVFNWAPVEPTNRWAVFDDSPSTLATNPEILCYIFKPGRVNSIALLELDATEVSVNLYAQTAIGQPPVEQYHGYNDLLTNNNVGNWYEYFFEPFYYQTQLTITNMVNASLLDMPQYSNTIMCITISKGTNSPSVGIIASGIVYALGNTQAGMSLGIIDYSKKGTDDYGNTVLVRRKFSKRFRSTFFLYSAKVDIVSTLLSQYRATPVVWIGADSNYSALVVYGFYRDWDIDIPNNIGSYCTIEIEGLT